VPTVELTVLVFGRPAPSYVAVFVRVVEPTVFGVFSGSSHILYVMIVIGRFGRPAVSGCFAGRVSQGRFAHSGVPRRPEPCCFLPWNSRSFRHRALSFLSDCPLASRFPSVRPCSVQKTVVWVSLSPLGSPVTDVGLCSFHPRFSWPE